MEEKKYTPSIIEQEFMDEAEAQCLLNDPEGRPNMKRDLLKKLGITELKVNRKKIPLAIATPEQLCYQIKTEYHSIQHSMGLI